MILLVHLLLAVAQPIDIPGDAACANPAPADGRPYTLCLAEAWFNAANADMERQLKVTLAHVATVRGRRAAAQVGDEQRQWVKRRDRTCTAQMARTPVTQVARNTLGCQTQWTEQRTARLKALAN